MKPCLKWIFPLKIQGELARSIVFAWRVASVQKREELNQADFLLDIIKRGTEDVLREVRLTELDQKTQGGKFLH